MSEWLQGLGWWLRWRGKGTDFIIWEVSLECNMYERARRGVNGADACQ
jgi:hypothetical protein